MKLQKFKEAFEEAKRNPLAKYLTKPGWRNLIRDLAYETLAEWGRDDEQSNFYTKVEDFDDFLVTTPDVHKFTFKVYKIPGEVSSRFYHCDDEIECEQVKTFIEGI